MNSRVLNVVAVVGSLVLAGWLAGCASPESRIRAQPELFASYPAETQALIREGKVGLGFDAAAVRLAVGEPDRKWRRSDESGESEVWAFTRFESEAGLPLYRGGYHRAYDGLYPYYEMYPTRRARDYFRITFRDGKVTEVEADTLIR